MTRFEAIEASRVARGEPDPTQGQRPLPTETPPPRKWKRSIYAWRSNPQPPAPAPGFAGMTLEKRRAISAKANAARKAKLSASRRSEIAARANAARYGRSLP